MNFLFSFGLLAQQASVCEINGRPLSQNIAKRNVINELSIVGRPETERLPFYFRPIDLQPIPLEIVTPEYRQSLQQRNEFLYMRADAVKALEQMLTTASREGISLFAHSSYRDYQVQCSVFSRKVKSDMELKMMSLEQAILSVNTRSAMPGQSEHQLGTAVDLVTDIPGIGYKLEYEMQNTPGFLWLQKNAHKYGFILSYPSSLEVRFDEPNPKTGYIYEPWHWRYIHPVYAKKFRECGNLSLREFLFSVSKDAKFACFSTRR
ncbi:MAG: D-alanyl-D-alanine carboxypeptidase family protein [Pseudobdellovibrionaceae bacterium]